MKDFLKQIFNREAEFDPVNPIDDENAVRKSITVYGRVQGVGFRYFVRQEAHNLGISGWVMNLRDGSVTMEVQGTPDVINNLIARLKKGNGFSKVERMESNDVAVIKGDNKFGIKY